jgi:antitoxin (DNA-binding transcriptional repressor) of toxin-antitoxin stability system
VKAITYKEAKLSTCIEEAQRERVLITRDGKPVVLIVGVEGMDEEQLQLGNSDEHWRLISERRRQTTRSRTQLEELLKDR